MKKKIAILGGEGFIGLNLVENLNSEYACTTLGLKKTPFQFSAKKNFLELNPYKSLLRDQYDVYIHLIDHNVANGEFQQNEELLMKNIKIPCGAHLLVLSSAVVYANPSSDYGKRKIMLENFYEEYCKRHDINLTIIRLFNIYGLYQIPFRQGSLIANIIYNHLNGVTTEINDMSASRDFIYSVNFAKIIGRIIGVSVSGKFDIASGEMITIGELLQILQDRVISDKILIKDNNIKEDIVCPLADLTSLGELSIHEDIEIGLRETYRFYQNNIEEIKKINRS